MPDHPHARGENQPTHLSPSLNLGPSPRAWGEHNPAGQNSQAIRTIPTRVGRTYSPSNRLPTHPDHPHARGENIIIDMFRLALLGPSPRAWGELTKLFCMDFPFRTIPTRVGRTPPTPLRSHQNPDHPHARGENLPSLPYPHSPTGPSPRAWGEHDGFCDVFSVFRTIPTRVGRTRGSTVMPAVGADHPHARGENNTPAAKDIVDDGPSPRAWGELVICFLAVTVIRTIPTRVGRTLILMLISSSISDHPHARGEN